MHISIVHVSGREKKKTFSIAAHWTTHLLHFCMTIKGGFRQFNFVLLSLDGSHANFLSNLLVCDMMHFNAEYLNLLN